MGQSRFLICLSFPADHKPGDAVCGEPHRRIAAGRPVPGEIHPPQLLLWVKGDLDGIVFKRALLPGQLDGVLRGGGFLLPAADKISSAFS